VPHQPIRGGPAGPEPYPLPLLDDYLAVVRRRTRDALPATALRTGSLATRLLLAHAASGEPGALARLLVAARQGRLAGLAPGRIDPGRLADLARVIALQDLLPEDQADGLALYNLALELFGPAAIPARDQGVHAQLAYHLGDHSAAAALLETYQQVPEQVACDLRIDLANPFRGTADAKATDWLRSLLGLLPEPRPTLAPYDGVEPFDRLAATGVRLVDAPQRISVIVTTFRPGIELLTAVRSLVEQSWPNLEILVVDDGSPPEHDQFLARCGALDHRIRLLKLDANHGTYVARNAGLEAASGEFVTFQDSDDWSHPRRLEHQAVPLLQEPALVATLTDGLRVTDDLVITRPGRLHRLLNTSSLMFRRDAVLRRIGYFDQVRKAADSEYHLRIEATFGTHAVHRDRSDVYALVRLSGGSLSRADFRAGWMHPARAAYRSAYHLWHQRIRAGAASPYLPPVDGRRPFPVPAHLRLAAPEPASPARYDVVFASEWRPFGGPQKSMLEEIRALTRRGMRVGVAQLEALRFMKVRSGHLCQPVQELINDGTVDHLLLCDEVETSLLVVRYPPVLQFAATQPSRIRARQVLILANQAPFERDGTDYRYVPQACTEVASQLFAVEPRWCPMGPAVREPLEAMLPPGALTPFDMPGIIDIEHWTLDRSRFRLDRPVIGRHSRDSRTKWPGDRETLLAVYPASDKVDVRVMGGATTPLSVLGTATLPANWVAYDYDEIGVRSFLNQLDYYVYFPHPDMVEAFGRATLEALAAGCVAILPHHFSATFGDAAVYCGPHEVQEVIRSFHSDHASYLDQSRLGQERVRKLYSHESYTDLVSSIVAGP
jgi:hypothetical protein